MGQRQLLESAIAWGPVFFGLGFLAPLIAQTLEQLGMHAPLGLSPVAFGLILGGTLGFVAKTRGSWL